MLRGHESLLRLVGKRQRNLSIQDVISSAAPSNPEVTGSSSSKVSIVAEEKLDATFEWVECPVCAKKIRGCDVYVNCHLDSCLDKPKKRSKRVQLTLLQFSSSKINREPFEEINQQSVQNNQQINKETTHIEQPETFTYVSSNNLQASSSDHSLKRNSTEKENEAELGSNEALTMPADRVLYNGCLETRIAGRKYNGESRCEVGMQVSLVREPDNPKDPFAIKVIAVESTGGPSLGHIPRNVSCYLSPLMDENVLHIEGHVAAISKSEEVILKLNCEELQDRLILSPIKEKMLATNWEKAMSTSFENRSSRYRSNFVYLLNTVLERDSHLFNSGELQFLNGFYLLSECAQSLFVRLVQRKGPWFRVQNIDYEDVVNMSSVVQELVDRSFFLESKLEHTPELLELLTVQELKHLNYTANLMKKSCVSLAKKSELISLIIDTLKAQQSLLSENGLLTLILETLGTCIRISDETIFLLWRLQRLFFLDGEQELNVFLLVDMGRAKYPNYKCASTTPVFATREALLAYEQALKLAQAVDMSMEANDKDSLTLCLQKARDELEVITRSNSNVTHLFLCRFSAAWVYTAICTLAVSILEKERRYAEAVDLLKQLLSTDYCTGRRGYWTMRLSIDLEHLQRCEESLQVAEKGLEDRFIRTGDRIGLQKRVLRLGKPPRRWRVPPFASMMKMKHKVVEILGRPLNNTIGMKSRFYGYDGNQCSVEELALQYYGDEGGGWKGIHSESGVWLTLFGLIMWDIIFMDVPDVFQTPFQNAPLDLDTDAFYTVRSTLIESRLKLVREGGGVDILTDTWQQNYGTFCRGVNWERCSLEDLQTIASCIGGPGLAVICKLLAEDHANWAAGMPDLLLWRPDHSDAKLVEVKGPSDRLSEQQEAWFIILAEADVHVELCKVSKQTMAASRGVMLASFLVSLPLILMFLLLPRFWCPVDQIAVQNPLLDEEDEDVGVSSDDLQWVADQLRISELPDPPKSAEEWSRMRKGINPRTREEQLYDLRRYHGISHYEGGENHTRLPCPSELLVEQHHSNYGEPWAGGRDVFEFIAKASSLKKHHKVLEVGCGTLRVGLHFIRYLASGNYHCIEKDPLSLMAAFSYELPSQGLLHKRPVIARSDNLEFELLGDNKAKYDVVYASAAFLHMPDDLVWTGLESLVPRIKQEGRMFVSHNIKFCTRLGADECKRRLERLKLNYVGKQTHDSLLFNHYEIWHQFIVS